jgi:hypothetical protein
MPSSTTSPGRKYRGSGFMPRTDTGGRAGRDYITGSNVMNWLT